jgi:hypothetical protein
MKSAARSQAARLGWEHRRENDERVLVNVAPEHRALFGLVKAGLRGSPDRRFESFEQYCHDHPGEAMAALQSEADDRLDELLAAREAADAAVVDYPDSAER